MTHNTTIPAVTLQNYTHILLYNAAEASLIIIELTILFKQNQMEFHERKVRKYSELVSAINRFMMRHFMQMRLDLEVSLLATICSV